MNDYNETLRADRAEDALAEAERKLARLLQMADAWEGANMPQMVRASAMAEAVRLVIRPKAPPMTKARLEAKRREVGA